MSEHFLTKTKVDLATCIQVDGDIVLKQYEALASFLHTNAGDDAVNLFAEPLVSSGQDDGALTISWYSDFEGEAVRINDLDDAAQQVAHDYLGRHMGPLARLAGRDPDGFILAAALNQMSANDIWVIGGIPVIANWGMSPASVGLSPASRTLHFRQTLGRFLPLAAAPALTPAEAALAPAVDAELASRPVTTQPTAAVAAVIAPAAGAATGAAVGAGVVGASAAQAAQPGVAVVETRTRLSMWSWVPLLILLLLAFGTLAWLLLPGTRLFAVNTETVIMKPERQAALAEDYIKGLRARQAELKAALAGAVCRDDGTLLMPNGRTMDGLLPPPVGGGDDHTNAAPDAIFPANPQQVIVPSDDPSRPQKTQTTLLDAIDRSTVLVVALGDTASSTGSGFVVSPGYILTNYHVIKDARSGGIMVTNTALGHVYKAEVVKTLGPIETQGGDFALLKISNTSLPSFPFHLTQTTLKLQNVIAAGFPGDILSMDMNFSALKEGDSTAVPSLTVTNGSVNSEQVMENNVNFLVHSADISSGNSGGPLVDMCGRVVGINTLVKVGKIRTLNIALAGKDIVSFLAGTPVQSKVISEACSPNVQRVVPPAETVEVAPPKAITPATPAAE